MKIAHILTRFSPEDNPGGVERVVEEIAKRQAEGNEVEIICRNQFNDASREEYEGIEVNRADTLDFSGIRTFSSLWTMRKLIQNSGADVFHVHDWSPYLNYIATGSPEKSVLTLHNLESNYFGSLIQNLASKKANITTAVSNWLKERTLSDRSIYDGVDLKKFSISEENKDFILFVGSLIERKGVVELANACSQIDLNLKMVGTGPLKPELKDFDIELLGRVSEDELLELYHDCAYFALPSRKEGFGLVWAEALACGKPVLATETGMGAEIPESCGKTISRNYNVEELKTGIEDLMENNYNSSEIREFAESNFDWDKINSKYMEAYREV